MRKIGTGKTEINEKKSIRLPLVEMDAEVMSNIVSTAFGSLPMMVSVLVSSDGNYAREAAYDTITHHYYKYPKGKEVLTCFHLTVKDDFCPLAQVKTLS